MRRRRAPIPRASAAEPQRFNATVSHTMRQVSVRQLRNETAEVVEAVESGELVTLTVHGRPVADIVPHAGPRDSIPFEETAARFAATHTGLAVGPDEARGPDLTTDDVIADVQAGYRKPDGK